MMEKFEKQYLDIEKELFEKLPEEEQAKRISELGEEGAIQQYGYEMSLRSMDKKEELVTPEEKESETYKRLEKAAQNVMKCFSIKYDAEKKRGQNLVLITDEGVPSIVRQAFIEQAGLVVANKDLRVMVSKKPEHSAESFGEAIGNKIISADKVILLTSMSRTHSKESRNALAGLSKYPEVATLQKQRQKIRESMFAGKSSIFSITDANNVEVLTEGAALENIDEMWERIDSFMKKFKNAKKAFIKTGMGTDLEIQIKEGTIAAESGKLDQPGNVANFPFGEVGCVPSWEGTNGVIVIDGLGGKGDSYIEEPIKLYIKNGKVVKVEGGKEADEFWEYLKQTQSKYEKENIGGKGNVFKLAEFSFGMNSTAWRIDKEGKKILPPTTLEGEKSLGTIHIALGNNALLCGLGGYGHEDSEYNDIDYHADQIILEPTVYVEDNKGNQIELMTNGKIKI
jgi:leucyl aminopeptidase (aminopeptidase T)